MLAVLGHSWGLCWRSWAALGAYCDGLGQPFRPMLAVVGRSLWPMLAVWGRSWGLCWRSWAALGARVGGLGALLGLMFAVLSNAWGIRIQSWAHPRAMWTVLGSSWGSVGDPGAPPEALD